jgi:hypothetical protein
MQTSIEVYIINMHPNASSEMRYYLEKLFQQQVLQNTDDINKRIF